MTGKKNTPAYIAQKKCQHSFTNRYLFQLRKISDKFPNKLQRWLQPQQKLSIMYSEFLQNMIYHPDRGYEPYPSLSAIFAFNFFHKCIIW